MGENLENKDWREEAPTLAGVPVSEGFSVPDGYFSTLDNRIRTSVYLEGLKTESADHSFGVPKGYFETLTERIEANALLESLKQEEEIFRVPADYFEQSRAAILSKTADTVEKSKIVRLWHSNLLKYASAACFVIVAGLGVYFNQETTVKNVNSTDIANEQMLFDIDEDVIIEHLTSPETNKVSNDQVALENYILTNFSSSDLTTDY
ncbi:hypothetical protein ACXZ1K_18055 [Pedobacter sp. PWIIR3]